MSDTTSRGTRAAPTAIAVMMLMAGGLALAGTDTKASEPTTQPASADANEPSADRIVELVDDLENDKLSRPRWRL
ncbi:MAG: hypothetical protein ACLFV7_09235 [Phycisphaerae bacterium]